MIYLLLALLVLHPTHSQQLLISSPIELKDEFGSKGIDVHAAPIGYKPQTGWFHGNAQIASPQSACDPVQPLNQTQNQNIFLFADDTSCLQSVKAQNLAESGAFVGVVKKNLNNTLHDRQISLVSIPILEMEASAYNKINQFIKANPSTTVTLVANFSSATTQRIKLDFWLTPTQKQSYDFILQLGDFIVNQPRQISFKPHFVFHSQVDRKHYTGCFSLGKYCPAEIEYEGKQEGTRIIAQSLRQIIIANRSIKDWFTYAKIFYQKCLLGQEDLWKNNNSTICSENAMAMAGINVKQIKQEYANSFEGTEPETDNNILLEEERQLYVYEQITKYPSILINKKQETKLDPLYIQNKICYKLHPSPSQQSAECQKITNPGTFTFGEVLLIMSIVLILMLVLMCGYRMFIYYQMRTEMRGQVDKSLQEYYRYMDSLEEEEPKQFRPQKEKEQTLEMEQFKQP